MAKTVKELYEERKKRVMDAIALKVPDRVPIYLPFGVFGTKYAGITVQEAFENTEKWQEINERVFLEYQPDYFRGHYSFDVVTNELVGQKRYRWPGHGLGPDASFQFVEGEYMKAEEYDAFLEDPSDFVLRVLTPRTAGNLAGFGTIPPVMSSLSGGIYGLFTNPDAIASLKTLVKAAESNVKYMKTLSAFHSRLEALGFPCLGGVGAGLPPFDFVSDFLRGLRGTTLDMFQRPDKLLAAEQKVLPHLINNALEMARITGAKFSFGATHRGSDGFMSIEQFERFYWPGLKAVLTALVDARLTPIIFWEGTWDQRLKYLRELPKGKIMGWFDRTDLFKVKKVIGDTMCICGDMPLSLLQTGTPEQVKEYAKKLIDVVGKGGGFIMGPNTMMDYAKPELVKVWVDFTREYGIY
jgi:uroporphyrinogen-III decarboxylase